MHVAAALSIANCRSLVYSSLYLSANYFFKTKSDGSHDIAERPGGSECSRMRLVAGHEPRCFQHFTTTMLLLFDILVLPPPVFSVLCFCSLHCGKTQWNPMDPMGGDPVNPVLPGVVLTAELQTS
jgi:hypothetical protein